MGTNAVDSLGSSTGVADMYAKRLAAVSVTGVPRNIAQLPEAEQVKAVSGQFEALLLRQFLSQSVGNIMGGEGSGASGSVYGYLLTDIISSKIAEGGGMGFGKVLQQQLSPHQAPKAAASTTLTPGNSPI